MACYVKAMIMFKDYVVKTQNSMQKLEHRKVEQKATLILKLRVRFDCYRILYTITTKPTLMILRSSRQLVLLWMAIIEQVGMFKVVVENLFAKLELEPLQFLQ